jgi:hypothetical protein
MEIEKDIKRESGNIGKGHLDRERSGYKEKYLQQETERWVG